MCLCVSTDHTTDTVHTCNPYVVVAQLSTARRRYTCFKNICSVWRTFIVLVIMDVTQTERKRLLTRALCYHSYRLASSAPRQKTSCTLLINVCVSVKHHELLSCDKDFYP